MRHRDSVLSAYLCSKSPTSFAPFCAYAIISMKRYANAALLSSAFLLRFRFLSYMLFLFEGYRSPGPWLAFPLIAMCCACGCDCTFDCGRIVAADEDVEAACTGLTGFESDDWREGEYAWCRGRMLDMVAIEPWLSCLAESCGSEGRASCVRLAAG